MTSEQTHSRLSVPFDATGFSTNASTIRRVKSSDSNGFFLMQCMLTPPQSEDMRPGQGEGRGPAAGAARRAEAAEAAHGAGGWAAAGGEASTLLPSTHPEERPDGEEVDELEAGHEAEAHEQAGQAAQGACGTAAGPTADPQHQQRHSRRTTG